MPKPKALISWSSGKDSAFSLHEVRRAGEFDVVGALTTVTETFERVSIHGVRQEILRAQCEAAGLPQKRTKAAEQPDLRCPWQRGETSRELLSLRSYAPLLIYMLRSSGS